MRWYWIDRFTEFVSGEYATSIKNVSLGEVHLHENFYSHPVMPNSLVVEGMAQTGGLLLGEASEYQSKLVLAKVSKVRFYFPARPGDTLTYTSRILNQSPEGALLSGTSHVGDRLQAEAEFYLAALGDRFKAQQLFSTPDFVRLLRLLRIYEVGKTADGEKLQLPEPMRLAELQAAAKGDVLAALAE
ncbi:MAG: 3-hydroxyacyl-ACP dehydratase FabZ family protein [Planctomycetota bacterium]